VEGARGEGGAYSFGAKDALGLLLGGLLEECLAGGLGHLLGQLLLPVEAEADGVALAEPASDLGPVLLDQAVVAATSGEDVLDLFVVQAHKDDAPAEEGLVDAVQGADVDFAGDVETLGVLVDFSQVGQRRRRPLVKVGAFEQCLELGYGFAWGVYRMSIWLFSQKNRSG